MIRKKIYIIDDDRDMREGLEAYLSATFDVRCFESGKHFLQTMKDIAKPDCILLDLRMPDCDGFALQSALNKAGYLAPVVFMSGDADKADVISAWREGAVDFVLKPFSAAEIKSCIDKLLQQQSPPRKTHGEEALTKTPLPITRREAEVLLLIGQGLRQHEVAEKLNISLRSVKMYRGFLKDKLNLNSVVEIARFYDQHKQAVESRTGTGAAE